MYNEENIKRIIANSNLLDYHNAVVCRHYNWFFHRTPQFGLIQVLQLIPKFNSPNKNNLFIYQLGLS